LPLARFRSAITVLWQRRINLAMLSGSTIHADRGGTKKQPHCWYTVELLSAQQARRVFAMWVFVLVLCALMTLTTSTQFNCYQLCNLHEKLECSVFGVSSPATCVDYRTDTWRSSHGMFELHANELRRFQRVIYSQPGGIEMTGKNQSRVVARMLPSSFDGARIWALSGNGSVVASYPTTVFADGEHLSLLLADGTFLPADAESIAVKLARPAIFVDTADGTTVVYPDASAGFEPPSIIFMTLSPYFAGFEVGFRYLCIAICLWLLARFYRGYMRFDRSDTDVMGFAFTDFTTENILVVAFHVVVILFCDPLAAWTLVRPDSVALRYWSDHCVYALLIAFLVAASLALVLTMTSVFNARNTWFRVVVAAVSGFFAVAYIVMDSVAFSQGSSVGLLVGDVQDTSNLLLQWLTIAIFIVFVVWAIIVVTLFVKNKHQIVWNVGERLYFGQVRLRLIIMRFVASCSAVFLIYWAFIYFPIMSSYSGYIPIFGRSGVVDVLCAVGLTTINIELWSVQRLDANNAPPRALVTDDDLLYDRFHRVDPPARDAHEPFTDNHHDGDDIDLDSDGNAAAGLAPPPTLLHMSSSVYAPPAADAEGEGEESFVMVESPKIVVLHIKPVWQHFKWKMNHFKFLDDFAHSGYYFLTEFDKNTFDFRHALVPRARSFLCWETLNSCLALSNEVYYDAPEDRVSVNIAGQGSCMENFILGCVGDGVGAETDAEKADAEVEDMPKEYLEPRHLDVAKLGYALCSSVNVADVQVVMCRLDVEVANNPDVMHESTHASFGLSRTALAHSGGGINDPLAGTDALLREPHVAVAFRGTANTANAVTDANFGRTLWRRLASDSRNQPKVHSGFAVSWEQLCGPVMDDLSRAIAGAPDDCPILITGHSMGGALACLCALEVRSAYPKRKVSVYTFGMPRLGNETFRRQYDKVVPETYRCVCENDKVAHLGHCGRVHVGRNVSIDRDGNWIVEPNGIEQRFDMLGGGGFAVKNHFLYRYARCVDKIFAVHGSKMRSFLAQEPPPQEAPQRRRGDTPVEPVDDVDPAAATLGLVADAAADSDGPPLLPRAETEIPSETAAAEPFAPTTNDAEPPADTPAE
jgi:hypothetical protein